MIDKILGRTIALEKALDASWLKNEVINNNMANVNTPGYKKKTIQFEEQLAGASLQFSIGSSKKDDKFVPIGNDVKRISTAKVTEVNTTSIREDGNNVDMDVEMAELAKNSIKYNALITQLSKQFSSIKNVIREGK